MYVELMLMAGQSLTVHIGHHMGAGVTFGEGEVEGKLVLPWQLDLN